MELLDKVELPRLELQGITSKTLEFDPIQELHRVSVTRKLSDSELRSLPPICAGAP